MWVINMIDAHSVKFHNQLSPEKKNLRVIVWSMPLQFINHKTSLLELTDQKARVV